MRKASFLLVAVVLAGCSAPMSQRAAMVRMTNAETVKDCAFLGQATGSSTLTGIARHSGYQNAINELLDRAAGMGASHVVLSPNSRPAYWTFEQNVMAEAYRCAK